MILQVGLFVLGLLLGAGLLLGVLYLTFVHPYSAVSLKWLWAGALLGLALAASVVMEFSQLGEQASRE